MSSLLYVLYSVHLFRHPITGIYHMYVALAIAVFTFIEIAVNIRGVIVYRHDHPPLIKMISLASSLICLVLTQSAILSFAEPGSPGVSQYTAFTSVSMGGIAAFLGILMIRRLRRVPITKTGGMGND